MTPAVSGTAYDGVSPNVRLVYALFLAMAVAVEVLLESELAAVTNTDGTATICKAAAGVIAVTTVLDADGFRVNEPDIAPVICCA